MKPASNQCLRRLPRSDRQTVPQPRYSHCVIFPAHRDIRPPVAPSVTGHGEYTVPTGKQTAPHPRPSRCRFFPAHRDISIPSRFRIDSSAAGHTSTPPKSSLLCALDSTVCPILGVSSTNLTFPRRALCGQRHLKPLAPRAACPTIRKARSLSTRAGRPEFVPLCEQRDPHRA